MHYRVKALGLVSTSVFAVMMLTPAGAVAAPNSGSSGVGSAGTGSAAPGPNVDAFNYAEQCPDIMMLAISGATDSKADRLPLDERDRSPISNWVGNVTVPTGLANSDQPGSVGWKYIPYPSDYGVGITRVETYQDSLAAGIASTNNLMNSTKASCGTRTKMVLLGYSTGADVMQHVVTDIGHRPADSFVNASDIAGVTLVADPYRPAGSPNMGDAGPAGGGFMNSRPKEYGALTDKITWSCRPLDIACDAPQKIAVLPLALNVFGQLHFTLLDPLLTVSDAARVLPNIAARTIVDISTKKDWIDSDATILESAMNASDQSYPIDPAASAAALAPDKLAADLAWATGPGAAAVQKKLSAEADNFIAENAGLPLLFTEPYLAFGFLQHLTYWNNNPHDNRVWESEKIVSWVNGLVDQQHAIDAAPALPAVPAPAPLAVPAPSAPSMPAPSAPAALPAPGLLPAEVPSPATPAPVKSSFENVLNSLGIYLPPGLLPADPNADNPLAP